MAYEKQEWKCGDTVTADKLNHMEDGIESANSGGTVELSKIKLGTAQGLVNGIVSAETPGAYFFNGGFDSSTTVGDKIGDKALIGFAFNFTSSRDEFYPFIGDVYTSASWGTMDDATLRNQRGGQVTGIVYTNNQQLISPGNVDIYAICI